MPLVFKKIHTRDIANQNLFLDEQCYWQVETEQRENLKYQTEMGPAQLHPEQVLNKYN